MNLSALKKIEIIKDLSRIPDESLDKVKSYIEMIAAESNIPQQKNVSLKGTWRNKGFEKIADYEKEVRQLRKELSDSILKRNV